MPIVFHSRLDAQAYHEQGGHRLAPRPEQCPHCQAAGRLIGHGTYARKPLDAEQAYYPLLIRRWLCRACGATVAMLPSFLLRFRHYLLAVMQAVVVGRYEQQQPWSTVEDQTTMAGAPAPRTIRRWCASFAQWAPAWLALVEAWLAEQDSASPWLDAHGEAAQARSTPRALLGATVHLQAWAQARWEPLRASGLAARLSVLWQWGHAQGLPRLI